MRLIESGLAGSSNEAVTSVAALPILGGLACVRATSTLWLAHMRMTVPRGVAVPEAPGCARPWLQASLVRAYTADGQRLV